MKQYQVPCKLIEEIDSQDSPAPFCPPAKLSMRVVKQKGLEAKAETATVVPITTVAGLVSQGALTPGGSPKLKITQNILQLVPHSSQLKGECFLIFFYFNF